jgi:hypothetical protein
MLLAVVKAMTMGSGMAGMEEKKQELAATMAKQFDLALTKQVQGWLSEDPAVHVKNARENKPMLDKMAGTLTPEEAALKKNAEALIDLERTRAKRLGATPAQLLSIDLPPDEKQLKTDDAA